MTRDDLRRVVSARPCRECGLSREAGVHLPAFGFARCRFRLDEEAFVEKVWGMVVEQIREVTR